MTIMPSFGKASSDRLHVLDGISSYVFPLSAPLCEVSREEATAYIRGLDDAKHDIVESLLDAALRSGLPAECSDCFAYAGVLAKWIADNSCKSTRRSKGITKADTVFEEDDEFNARTLNAIFALALYLVDRVETKWGGQYKLGWAKLSKKNADYQVPVVVVNERLHLNYFRMCYVLISKLVDGSPGDANLLNPEIQQRIWEEIRNNSV
jgi:hypothetical protein